MRLPSMLVLVVAIAGCGSARVLERTRSGGVLAIHGFRAAASGRAHDLMVDRCGGPYTVVSEREEPVGDASEYRVHFVCGATPGQPHSQYAPPEPDTRFPDMNRVFLD